MWDMIFEGSLKIIHFDPSECVGILLLLVSTAFIICKTWENNGMNEIFFITPTLVCGTTKFGDELDI